MVLTVDHESTPRIEPVRSRVRRGGEDDCLGGAEGAEAPETLVHHRQAVALAAESLACADRLELADAVQGVVPADAIGSDGSIRSHGDEVKLRNEPGCRPN